MVRGIKGLDLVYLVVLFVLIFLDIAVSLIGGWLLPLVFGLFSLTFAGLSLQSDFVGFSDIPFSPYLQLLLGLVGVVCLYSAVHKYRNPV